MILSSHILSEVSAVCDHILIIDRGKLIASDTPENLERQMAGAAGMELLVKGQEEEIREILEAIDGAEEIAVSESGEEGVRKVTFQLMGENCLEDGAEDAEREESEDMNIIPQTDIRETIFFAFADRRIPILSMHTSKASLEEVFLELTADNASGAEGEEIDSNNASYAAEENNPDNASYAAEEKMIPTIPCTQQKRKIIPTMLCTQQKRKMILTKTSWRKQKRRKYKWRRFIKGN